MSLGLPCDNALSQMNTAISSKQIAVADRNSPVTITQLVRHTGILQLLHDLVETETCRFLAWRKFTECPQEIGNVFLCGNEEEYVVQHAVRVIALARDTTQIFLDVSADVHACTVPPNVERRSVKAYIHIRMLTRNSSAR